MKLMVWVVLMMLLLRDGLGMTIRIILLHRLVNARIPCHVPSSLIINPVLLHHAPNILEALLDSGRMANHISDFAVVR